MQPRTIVESRLKTLLGLAFFAALTGAWAYAMAQPPSSQPASVPPWLGVIGGLGAGAFGWLLVRPMKLRLDEEGFELSGGFYLRPVRIAWRDVDRFTAVRVRYGFMLQYSYQLGHARPGRVARLLGLDQAPGSLPSGWPMSAPALAQLLNDYCWEATHAHRGSKDADVTAAAP